ncbi:Hypothetical predicted protein, partial [Pelobates cultripes]
MAPMYANAYMYQYEMQYILQRYDLHITRYFRFIDDILILWNGTKEEALQFTLGLNTLPTPVKMTSHVDEKSVQFLDVEIMIIDEKLEFRLFTKPTDRNTILHFDSFHPRHLKTSLPSSQFLRVLRNNSLSQQCNLQLEAMYKKFWTRGYPRSILEVALKRAKMTHSTSEVRIGRATNTRLIFPMQFNTASTEITSSIRKNWNTLAMDPTLPENFRQKPLFCYRRNRNLRDML